TWEETPPEKLTAAAWDRCFALNATAPYLLTAALAPALRAARGNVIAITCITAERPMRECIPYAASKAALAHLGRGLALGLAPEVRVNAVAPGTVLPPVTYNADAIEQIRAEIPLLRIGTAEDVARAVVFLLESDFITGQSIATDGGRSVA